MAELNAINEDEFPKHFQSAVIRIFGTYETAFWVTINKLFLKALVFLLYFSIIILLPHCIHHCPLSLYPNFPPLPRLLASTFLSHFFNPLLPPLTNTIIMSISNKHDRY
jgi:hypothetical protein